MAGQTAHGQGAADIQAYALIRHQHIHKADLIQGTERGCQAHAHLIKVRGTELQRGRTQIDGTDAAADLHRLIPVQRNRPFSAPGRNFAVRRIIHQHRDQGFDQVMQLRNRKRDLPRDHLQIAGSVQIEHGHPFLAHNSVPVRRGPGHFRHGKGRRGFPFFLRNPGTAGQRGKQQQGHQQTAGFSPKSPHVITLLPGAAGQ